MFGNFEFIFDGFILNKITEPGFLNRGTTLFTFWSNLVLKSTIQLEFDGHERLRHLKFKNCGRIDDSRLISHHIQLKFHTSCKLQKFWDWRNLLVLVLIWFQHTKSLIYRLYHIMASLDLRKLQTLLSHYKWAENRSKKSS